jgi:mono/diheme cytochrome c family protein
MTPCFKLAATLLMALLVGCGGPSAPATEPTPAPADDDDATADDDDAATPTSATPAPEAPLPGDPGAGAAIYAAYCIACHMPDGTGLEGTLAADWVHDMSRRAKSDAELLESIADGIDDTTMVAWSATLDETMRKDVLSYVRIAFMGHSGARAPAATPAAAPETP